MTTVVEPTTLNPVAYEPMYALTAQQIEDIRTDGFRAGYRLGRVHEAEAHTGGGTDRLPTTRTA